MGKKILFTRKVKLKLLLLEYYYPLTTSMNSFNNGKQIQSVNTVFLSQCMLQVNKSMFAEYIIH